MFYSIQYNIGWLAASNYFHNQLGSFIHYIITHVLKVQMFEKCVHQIDIKNEWLVFQGSFMAKFGLVFVLTMENAFP